MLSDLTNSLCADIIRSFVLLEEETQQRNIVAWRPVVIDVLEGYTNFPHQSFDKHIETFYPLAVALLEKEVGTPDLRNALWGMFRRVGELKFGMPEYSAPLSRGRENSVASTRNGSVGGSHELRSSSARSSRRGSRVSRTGTS